MSHFARQRSSQNVMELGHGHIGLGVPADHLRAFGLFLAARVVLRRLLRGSRFPVGLDALLTPPLGKLVSADAQRGGGLLVGHALLQQFPRRCGVHVDLPGIGLFPLRRLHCAQLYLLLRTAVQIGQYSDLRLGVSGRAIAGHDLLGAHRQFSLRHGHSSVISSATLLAAAIPSQLVVMVMLSRTSSAASAP